MKPWQSLSLFLGVLAAALAFAIPRWLDTEPDVYEAALSGQYFDDIAVASSPSTCGAPESAVGGISSELLSAFRVANRSGASLGNVSGLSSHFAIANSAQIAALESQGLNAPSAGSAHLRLLRISRVGFDAQKTEALLCVRAPGNISLVHLRKVNGIWHIVNIEPLQVA